MKYSFTQGLLKAIWSAVLFAAPFIVDALFKILPSDWLNLTIGGLLVLVANWLKVRYGVKVV